MASALPALAFICRQSEFVAPCFSVISEKVALIAMEHRVQQWHWRLCTDLSMCIRILLQLVFQFLLPASLYFQFNYSS